MLCSGLTRPGHCAVGGAHGIAGHTVRLLRPGGEEERCECNEDRFLLESAEEQGIELPWGCRGGSCGSCAALLVEGQVELEEQSALEEAHLERGLILLCSARPLTDCVVVTDRFEEL